MNFNIYVNDQLGAKLLQLSKATGKTKNAIIRQAIEEWLHKKAPSRWPESIISFQGIDGIEAFESSRSELREPEANPFG